jgi:hypothetical protein
MKKYSVYKNKTVVLLNGKTVKREIRRIGKEFYATYNRECIYVKPGWTDEGHRIYSQFVK